MEQTMYWIAIFVIVAVYYLIHYLKWRREVLVPLEKFPGYFRVPILGTMYRYIFAKDEDFEQMILDEIDEKGHILRTWVGSTPIVEISSPEFLETIMKSSAHINKANLYEYIHPWLGEGLLTSGGSKWHKHRKLITPTFHFKILEQFMDVFAEKTDILLKILDTKADGRTFNIFTDVNHCALDIICETAMGVAVNAMEDKDNKYVKAVYNMTEQVSWRMMWPFISDFIYYRLNRGKQYKKNLQILHDFTDRVIAERKELLKNKPKVEAEEDEEVLGKKKRTSFLDLLIEVSEDNTVLTDKDIREEVDTFMFEGHDTTSAAMSWTLFLLGNNPDIQERAYEEVRAILGDRRVPTSITDLNEMKYLERIIKEGLRMYPIVPTIGRKLTEEVSIGGYKIPAGIQVGLHIYGMQRNEKFYPNPNKFDPDRFLPEKSVDRHPYAFVPFSAGPRNCIGQKFALYEEKTILSSIINRYKIKSLEKQEEIKATVDLILRPKNGILVELEKRI